MFRKILIIIAWLLTLVAGYVFYGEVRVAVEKPRISTVPSITFTQIPTVTVAPTLTVTPTLVPEKTVAVPTDTARPSLIKGYWLDGRIDLASGKPTALSIRLPGTELGCDASEKCELPSTWAKSYAFAPGDEGIFDPHKSTIYSLPGDMIVMYAHSGRVYYKPILFGSNLDLYLRRSDAGDLNFSDGEKRLADMVGGSAYLCQTDKEIPDFKAFEPRYGCSGEVLELKTSAAILVTQEYVPGFNQSTLEVGGWVTRTYPGRGFEQLNPENSFLFVTCVGQYPDQPDVDGVEEWEYNRVIVLFTIVPRE